MITIALNNAEKNKLIEILEKDGSLESREFIRRIDNSRSFYSGGVDESIFNFHEDQFELLLPK